MEYTNRCLKFKLPNDNCLDLLNDVLLKIRKYCQVKSDIPESAGFLLGYQNINTQNITIADCTLPQPNDLHTRFFCKIKDAFHFASLREKAKSKNYYVGVWHTHPQEVPVPSSIDWRDWKEALLEDKSGTPYIFFIILGTKEFRVWLGDPIGNTICEIFESEMVDEIYTER